ncbi:MAG: phospholipase C, phosphocholine-specific [Chitinophagaceae bacterium]
MDTRRDFIKKAALLSGGTGLAGMLPAAVVKAMAINPAPGTTYQDAEHIVILMQENRSFDHAYGTLQGVRGFNDPRAIVQPDSNLVWLQKNAAGETYAPFRLNMKETNATWLGSLPHSWTNQVDARNGGKHDKWLIAKPSGHKGFAKVPLTMGYYNREDLPFYYSLADAFTICDQNFSSSLTGTTPNRLYLWSGTVRAAPHAASFAHVRNEDVDFFKPANWTTFPERLEENDISWKIYQNEISLPSGLEGEEDAWLSNFTDNPIEFFSQYNVQYAASYSKYCTQLLEKLPGEIETLKTQIKTVLPSSASYASLQNNLAEKELWLARATEASTRYTKTAFDELPQRDKNIHKKAFTINNSHPHYRQLETLQYSDGGVQREMKVPKGDVLHQFRQDVDTGKLPTVSWIVGPENFSDHPGAPWYGAWYVAEVMDILTKQPAVWKKTIFILCYDENDGYFDHVPPFVAPDPSNKESGQVSAGIDAATEFVTMAQDTTKYAAPHARESPIGLGYRVPLVIASPWSRGGAVCSQVFDHTSIIQFMEKFLSKKINKKIEEPNISQWRRTVCGDLTAVFKPYNGEKITAALPVVSKETFFESIQNARFKKDPSGYRPLSGNDITAINNRTANTPMMPAQEKGIRPACSIPYELYADGRILAEPKIFKITFCAGTTSFGLRSAGAPFLVYAHMSGGMQVRSYAVSAGDIIADEWKIADFRDGLYHLSLYGPNGFFREFRGSAGDPPVTVNVAYESANGKNKKLTGNIEIKIVNQHKADHTLEVIDNSYSGRPQTVVAHGIKSTVLNLSKSFGWYDFTVRVKGFQLFEMRFAGHVETGQAGFTDPLMGGVLGEAASKV